MKILKVTEGWNGKNAHAGMHPSYLACVLFEFPPHSNKLSAFVVFDKHTGELRTHPRVFNLGSDDLKVATWDVHEGRAKIKQSNGVLRDPDTEVQVSDEVMTELVAAARKFAGDNLPCR